MQKLLSPGAEAALGRLTRRDLLRIGGGAALAFAGASAIQACTPKHRYEGPLKTLSAESATILERAAEAIVPDALDGLPTVRAAGIVAAIDAYISLRPEGAHQELAAALQIFDAGPVLFFESRRRFSSSPVEVRRELLAHWRDSKLAFRRTVYKALKDLMANVYFASPSTWTALQYDGPWVGRYDIPPVEQEP